MKKVLLLFFCLQSFLLSTYSYSQVLDPNDPVVRWEEGDPVPSQPAFGQIGKWIAKSVVRWDNEPFKPYIYKGMPFRLMFPKNYDPNRAEKYPIIVMFHGRGEAGDITDNERQLIHGAEKHKNAIENGTYDGFLLFGQNTSGWWNSYLYGVINDLITNKMPTEINIDLNKVYVHGLSSGGIGVWEMVINYPRIAAAVLPMSASSSYQTNILNKLKFTPMWIFQGSEDSNPPPERTISQVNLLKGLGADVAYTIYEGVGHGTWNRAYSESDFFPFMNRANKVNPWVLFGKSEFCPGDQVNVTIGVTAGFDGYQWRKNGNVISGANGNTVSVSDYGVYDVRIKRGSDWSYWSPTPVEIKIKEPTVTPPIQIEGLASKVIPAPDGNNGVTLELPDGYVTYQWKKVGNNSVIGSSRMLTVTEPGEYIASVTELNGCSSSFSDPFSVVNANGSNGPDAVNGLLAYAPSKTTIQLNWSDNPNATYNETGFEVYRGDEAGGPYQLVAITDADELTYLDEDLAPNTEYFYIVRPVNDKAAGPESTEVNARTQVDKENPAAPLNLKVVSTTNNSVSLAWDASTDNVGIGRYDVYQNGVKAVVTEGTSTTIYNLVEEQVYTFYVKARDITGNESAASNQVTAAAIFSGLTYKYYEGSWNSLPDFNALTPDASGRADNIDISIRQQDDNFAVLWEGFVNIPIAGTYTFETRSDDGSKLYIGEYDEANLLVNNDGLHGTVSKSASYTFASAGAYPIAVSFFEKGGGQVMEVYWSSDQGLAREKMPNEAFGSDFIMPGLPPEVPTQLAATSISYEQIDLTWSDNSNNETGFQLYRADNPVGPFYPVAIVGVDETSYSDLGLDAETTYFYKVMAIGQYGESGFSDEIKRGLDYSYYEQNFSNLDQLETATPIKTGVSDDFDLSSRERDSNIAFKWEGTISLPATGDYKFYTRSDDGSELFINGTQVVFNDYNQGMTERGGTINLVAGNYPIKVTWRQGGGGYGLEVRYEGPGISKGLIPDEVLRDPDINATTATLPPAPAAPSGLVATPLTNSSIKIDWADNSNNEQGFEVYRSNGNNTNYLLFETLDADATSYTDEGLFTGVSYYYKVVAVNVGGTAESGEVVSKTLNTVPSLTGIIDQTMRFGTSLEITLFGEDIDGNSLSYNVQNLPSFASLVDYGDGTGQITFTPADAQQGNYQNIVVELIDNEGGVASEAFSLLVNDNYVPVVAAISDVMMKEQEALEVSFSATDQNGVSDLVWTVSGLPAFGVFESDTDGTAKITFNPGLSDVGSYPIQISVTDSEGAISAEAFTLEVEDISVGLEVYVNLNGPSYDAGWPWNNTHDDPASGSSFGPFLDAGGAPTTVGLRTSDFGVNTLGSVSGSGVYPSDVMRTSYWSSRASESFTLTGLPSGYVYELVFFGSRDEGGQTNRTTDYSVGGETVSLNASKNSTETVSISGLSADASGELTVTVSKGSGSAYSYLNALVVKGSLDDGTPPAAPRDLSASLGAGPSVGLSWLDAAYNETGYEVWRSTSEGGPYALLSTADADASVYVDNAVSGSTVYYYKVRGVNAYGGSAYSGTVSVGTPNAPPVLSPVGTVGLKSGEALQVAVIATDGDPGDEVSLSATGLPAFAVFEDQGSGNGTLSLSPQPGDEGSYMAIATASDQNGGTAQQEIEIVVTSGDLTTIYVNFNEGLNAPSPWNNTAAAPTANRTISDLKDETNTGTGISLRMMDAWSGSNTLGINTGNDSGIYPDNVIQSAYWESTGNNKRIRISGLTDANKYNFIFFASRDGGGNRTTNYTINGETVSLNASYNGDNTVQINGVSPDASGEVTINAQKASGASYGYINALIIQAYEDDGLPLSPDQLIVAGTSKTDLTISWADNSDNETGFEIWKSSVSEGGFSLYHTTSANVKSFVDNVPENSTFYYKVRAINTFGESSFTSVVGGSTIAFTLSVNFNVDNPAGAPWNNMNTDPFPGTVLSGLKNDDGNNTGMSITIVESSLDYDEFSFGFDGMNPFGMNTGNNSGVVPDNVMRSSYWMDPGKTAQFLVKGMNLSYGYNFIFFASRDGDGNRSTDYIIDGRTATLNAAKNTQNTTQINGISPNDNGEVLITVATSPGSMFGYINGLIVQSYVKPQGGASARVANSFQLTEEFIGSEISGIYPNPFTNTFSVDVDLKGKDELKIKVLDLSGRVVYKHPYLILEKGVHNVDIDLTDIGLNKGMYLLEVSGYELGTQVFKLIKN
ncbi:PA14 domain-containing protein (plasmid) [Flammeovirgaceae bacterium SG7u.111]|nr:PA14 domain-containing protein [Flammeovirgaceae bacterium SG7u.132]WPO38819.1 PA14 domain-containing protein [Flammeovirgaceae bacterium SG7u.111]